MKKILIFIFVLTVVYGCTTSGFILKEAKTSGNIRTYNIDYNKAFQSVLCACQALGLEIKNQDIKAGNIVAKHGMSVSSYGELIGIWIEKIADEKTNIYVSSRPKLITQIIPAPPKWSNKIHYNIKQCIKKGGKGS